MPMGMTTEVEGRLLPSIPKLGMTSALLTPLMKFPLTSKVFFVVVVDVLQPLANSK